jgi:hypothetical protein
MNDTIKVVRQLTGCQNKLSLKLIIMSIHRVEEKPT